MTVAFYRQEIATGSPVSLDGIPSDEIQGADFAFTLDGSTMFSHKYDPNSLATPLPPSVVIPVDLPETSSGRWIMQTLPAYNGLLPPASISIHGNFFGLGYKKYSDTELLVYEGNCYDSHGTTILSLLADTVVSVGLVGSDTMMHIFLTGDGSIQFDENIEGETLLGGGVQYLRYIGTFWTDHAGAIIDCIFDSRTSVLSIIGDYILASTYAGGGVSVKELKDITGLTPWTRLGSLYIGTKTNSARVLSVATSAQGAVFCSSGYNAGIDPGGRQYLEGEFIYLRNSAINSSSSAYTLDAYLTSLEILR
jgi:hypothetical protein